MPAQSEEVQQALEEGIEIIFLVAPSKVLKDKGTLKLELVRMELGEPDSSGRRRPVPIKGSEFSAGLDTLIAAIGEQQDVPAGFRIEVGRGNVVKIGEDLGTNRRGVFAGGDCESGPALASSMLSLREEKQLSPLTVILVAEGTLQNILSPLRKLWLGQMMHAREKDWLLFLIVRHRHALKVFRR